MIREKITTIKALKNHLNTLLKDDMLPECTLYKTTTKLYVVFYDGNKLQEKGYDYTKSISDITEKEINDIVFHIKKCVLNSVNRVDLKRFLKR